MTDDARERRRMTPHDVTRALLAPLAGTGKPLPAGNAESAGWVLDELDYVWQHAQAEAELAYREWRRRLGAEAYVVYRAAQDRADVAQDALAQWVRAHGDALIGWGRQRPNPGTEAC